MKKKFSILRVLILLLALFLVAFSAFLVTQLTLIACPDEWSMVEEGMNVDAVKSVLGEPIRDCDLKEERTECFLRGYDTPSELPTNRAMIYQACDKALYVFLDEKGEVEMIWWGNS